MKAEDARKLTDEYNDLQDKPFYVRSTGSVIAERAARGLDYVLINFECKHQIHNFYEEARVTQEYFEAQGFQCEKFEKQKHPADLDHDWIHVGGVVGITLKISW